MKKDRFVKVTDADPTVDWDLVERARYLAGLKGYVTNIGETTMGGERVVAAYHDLYQVERSFLDGQVRPGRPTGLPSGP